MELIQLKYFVTIAQTVSFTRAAEVLHVSQPALSYQMRRFEGELGTRLFERKGRSIALSPDGELFLPLAQDVLLRADEAVRVLKANLGVEAAEVRMGCNPSVSTYVVPGLLSEFHRNYPRVRVELVEGGDSDLLQMVQKGSIDFAVAIPPGAPRTMSVTLLGTEDLHIVTSLTHRLAERESVGLSELEEEDWVFPADSYSLSILVRDACRRSGFEARAAYQADTIEAVKNFVRQGLGISALPNIALQGSRRQGLGVVNIQGGLTRDLSLIRGKDRSMTGAARALTELVSVSVAEMMKRPPSADLVSAEAPEGEEA
jgi:DNA-binding transcriptional LysR family regulator